MSEALFDVAGETTPAAGPRYPVGVFEAVPLLTNVTVRGLPVQQGSLVKGRYGGIHHDNEAKLKPWRKAIADAIDDATRAAGLRVPLKCDEPVRVVATFTMLRPASYPKTRRVLPQKRPDVDKLARALLDALTESAVIVDDSQVVELRLRKAYPGEHPQALPLPGVRFSVAVLS